MLIDPTYDAAPSNVKIMAFSFTRGGQTTVVLGAIAGFAFLTRLPHRRAGPVQHPMDPTMVKTSHWLWHNPDLTNASWLARMSTWASRASPHRFAMALYATNRSGPS